MKKLVLIGGTASLARYLIPELSKHYEVVSMGRKGCDVYCDLSDNLNQLVLPEGTDVVIHVAASFNSSNDEEILETEEINALGTLKVCMAAHRSSIKQLIVISSLSAILDKNSEYYNIYSISKKHSEELADYYCSSRGVPLTILRPSQIYDVRGEFRKHQPLLYLMADNAEIGRDINIYGTNDAKRNYIHVEDLTEIVYRVINLEISGTYSCTYPEDIRLSEIAKAALSEFNKGGNIVFLSDKNDIPDNIFPRDMFLYDKIAFYPKIDIIKGMRRICYYRKRSRI